MSKHTPWEIEWGNPIAIGGGIAFVPQSLDGTHTATAYLISQAPAMLEALEMAVRQNEHDMLMTGEELRKCAAVIRAAKGEA